MATEILQRPFRFNYARIGVFQNYDGTSFETNNVELGEGVTFRDIPKYKEIQMPLETNTIYAWANGVFSDPWTGAPSPAPRSGDTYASLQIVEASNGHKYWTGQTRTFDVWKYDYTFIPVYSLIRTKYTVEYTFQETDFATVTNDDGTYSPNPFGPSTYYKKRGFIIGQYSVTFFAPQVAQTTTVWILAN